MMRYVFLQCKGLGFKALQGSLPSIQRNEQDPGMENDMKRQRNCHWKAGSMDWLVGPKP